MTLPGLSTEVAEDICGLTLIRRIAALVDREPNSLRAGEPIPRGWHIALFTESTPQSRLRSDGLGGLGAQLPDLGLPRIMAAGRRLRFGGDIFIGDAVQRISSISAISEKQGRSGRFAIVTVEHRIFARDSVDPVLVEQQDYVMRPDASSTEQAPAPSPPGPEQRTTADRERIIVPDETMLLRYCAITFNTHRIYYDQPYTVGVEKYPALVVNGGIPAIFLFDMFRAETCREPISCDARNLAPLYCGQPMRLSMMRDGEAWRLWAEDEQGRIAMQMTIQ